MERHRSACLQTPVGCITLIAAGEAITELSWSAAGTAAASASAQADDVLRRGIEQLDAYFAGDLRIFDLPLLVAGSDYQRAVCAAIAAIPFGETRSYGQLAEQLGSSAQAVGNACGANPIPIIIPCHRVLGRNGLGGFSGQGGVETKVALLRHEGAAGLLI
ncbi:methylated-DNA--[protein]-cysteine S-methyltransferase [Phaeobacter sp. QD34_3]|uniref:methylated-DNA--[protein]-cysteine S-methyltransferase n=1 Tax=unclassified Phaeobacter TaxID=2621772 RepID=UPI00237F6DAB|nr:MULTISPECIES: methylated-DNA--[protein]-cysteine S-methyltransferase [unclassified Phaeobacter]MDE4132729.1 methylated-DNA--[protein]-cysteine S-methyltransferase [Phaeobacter sp. QD34_3]MDE4136478.1 methylated-DNA--[protein]-cysteine S-methyltransferase [Phaeobacter sp. QD34_24]MDE4173332.1 methylated-DNA--[protein]-cysteine S-methyltransferase [Phaeobacter sp. PT47_59]